MIFILGGNGFVGSALIRYCIKKNIPHKNITRENYAQFIGQSCNVFINANGNAKMYLANTQPINDFEANVRSVYASLIDFKSEHYVYLSTIDVYPEPSSPQTSAEDLTLDVSKMRPYGFHKYLAENCVRHLHPHWLILRLGGMVGENLIKNPIFDLINNKPLWVDPLSSMQFINTNKVAEIIFHLLNKKIFNDIFNICGANPITLQEIINKLEQNIFIEPNNPRVHFDTAINKIQKFFPIPDTKVTLNEFLLQSPLNAVNV